MKAGISSETYMRYATDQARLSSTCSRRSVGCVIVRAGQVLVVGHNGTIGKACIEGGCDRCADESIPSGTRMEECVCVHAEAFAIGHAARYGIVTNRAIAFVTHRPCTECAKLLAMAGIERVYYLHDYPGTYAPIPIEQLGQD